MRRSALALVAIATAVVAATAGAGLPACTGSAPPHARGHMRLSMLFASHCSPHWLMDSPRMSWLSSYEKERPVRGEG